MPPVAFPPLVRSESVQLVQHGWKWCSENASENNFPPFPTCFNFPCRNSRQFWQSSVSQYSSCEKDVDSANWIMGEAPQGRYWAEWKFDRESNHWMMPSHPPVCAPSIVFGYFFFRNWRTIELCMLMKIVFIIMDGWKSYKNKTCNEFIIFFFVSCVHQNNSNISLGIVDRIAGTAIDPFARTDTEFHCCYLSKICFLG